jgi:hypothetical protein
MAYMDEKSERNAALLRALHGEPVPEIDETKPPEFDGGVREPAPAPSDPVQEHNKLVVDWLQAKGPEGW